MHLKDLVTRHEIVLTGNMGSVRTEGSANGMLKFTHQRRSGMEVKLLIFVLVSVLTKGQGEQLACSLCFQPRYLSLYLILLPAGRTLTSCVEVLNGDLETVLGQTAHLLNNDSPAAVASTGVPCNIALNSILIPQILHASFI